MRGTPRSVFIKKYSVVSMRWNDGLLIDRTVQNGGAEMFIKSNICVMGIGGGGRNIVTFLHANNLSHVRYLVLDTDLDTLSSCVDVPTLSLATGLPHGNGLKGCAQLGVKCAELNRAEISMALAGVDFLIIAAALGGGTGSGAIIPVLEIANELNIKSMVMLTLPFDFEGKRRNDTALQSLSSIVKICPHIICEKLDGRKFVDTNRNFSDYFNIVHSLFYDAVKLVIEKFQQGQSTIIDTRMHAPFLD